jgi:hypothetical protein
MENKLTMVVMDGALFELHSKGGFLLDPLTGKRIWFRSFQRENGLCKIILDTNTKEVAGVPGQHLPFDSAYRTIVVEEYLFSKDYRENGFYTQLFNALNYEDRRNILILEPKHEGRLFRGEKPTTTVMTHEYEIRSDEPAMVSLEGENKTIWLDRLRHMPGGAKCFFYFDWAKNEVVDLDLHRSGYPPTVVRIEIDDKLLLDPIGFALKQGKPGTTYLNIYPFESHRKTDWIPLAETWYKHCLAYNKWREIQAPGQQASREKATGIHF